MATFSQQFLANLSSPTGMLQGAANLGAAIGGVPGQMKEKRILGEQSEELENSGLKPNSSGYLAMQARQASERGDRDLAIKYSTAAAQAKNTEETLRLARVKANQEGITFTQGQEDRTIDLEAKTAIAKGVILDLDQSARTKKNLDGDPLSAAELQRVNRMLMQAAGAGIGAADLIEQKNNLIGAKDKELFVITDAEGNQKIVDIGPQGYPNLKPGETISKIASTVYEGTAGVTGGEKQFDITPEEFGGDLEGVDIIKIGVGIVPRIRGAAEGFTLTDFLVDAGQEVQAYQKLASVVKGVEAAFSNSNKFPVAELRQIQKLGLSDLGQSWFASESGVRNKLKSTVDMFETMRAREIDFQNDPNTESGAKRNSQDKAKVLSAEISKIKGILQSGQQENDQQEGGLPENIEALARKFKSEATPGE